MHYKIVQKSILGLSCLGLREGPKMLQEGLRDAIWTILDRFWIEFWSKFDQILTKCWRNWTEFVSIFALFFAVRESTITFEFLSKSRRYAYYGYDIDYPQQTALKGKRLHNPMPKPHKNQKNKATLIHAHKGRLNQDRLSTHKPKHLGWRDLGPWPLK